MLALQLLLGGCGEPPAAEQGVRTALENMASALEQRDSGVIGDHLDENFHSSGQGHGISNRKDAMRMLLAVFYRHQSISVTLTNIEVTPDGMNRDRASATFNALTTGGDGGLLPATAQLYRVESDWQLSDGEWRMTAMKARRALEP